MKTMQKNAGFTLIEVLITMGILAIGLLGLLTLQGVAMKSNSSILSRSQAANLASSIIDAMRANMLLQTNSTDYIPNPEYSTSLTPEPVCTTPLTDESESIAAQDVAAWRNNVACTLPQGTGSIALDGTTVTVTVQWNNSRNQTEVEQSSGQDPIQTFTMKTNL